MNVEKETRTQPVTFNYEVASTIMVVAIVVEPRMVEVRQTAFMNEGWWDAIDKGSEVQRKRNEIDNGVLGLDNQVGYTIRLIKRVY